MSESSGTPDISGLEIPMDAWTEPFWEATADHRLVFPACGDCGTVRWPPGPFCPTCQSQRVKWRPAGKGRVYSFTIVREASRIHVPALIEFPAVGRVHLLAAIVDTPVNAIEIGMEVSLSWSSAANATVPVFSISD